MPTSEAVAREFVLGKYGKVAVGPEPERRDTPLPRARRIDEVEVSHAPLLNEVEYDYSPVEDAAARRVEALIPAKIGPTVAVVAWARHASPFTRAFEDLIVHDVVFSNKNAAAGR